MWSECECVSLASLRAGRSIAKSPVIHAVCAVEFINLTRKVAAAAQVTRAAFGSAEVPFGCAPCVAAVERVHIWRVELLR